MADDVASQIGQAQAAYARCIDNGDLEAWPEFFVDQCTYKITTADNHRNGYTAGIVYADSQGMLRDRVAALREANIYERQMYRHLVGLPAVLREAEGIVRAETSFLVVRIMRDGRMDLFATGRYLDVLVDEGGALRFRERIVVCDSRGAICRSRGDLTGIKQWVAEQTNPEQFAGSVNQAVHGADVFIGVSVPNVLTPEDVKAMAKDPVVFALANPIPEIQPEAVGSFVRVMATGRSDYPNQINNVLVFPGIFKGALEVGATEITKGMKLAAADALAKVVGDDLAFDHVIPSVFDKRVSPSVAEAVGKAAREDDVIRVHD